MYSTKLIHCSNYCWQLQRFNNRSWGNYGDKFNFTITVYAAASNKAEEDSGNAGQPTYATLTINPNTNIIGVSTVSITANGLIDSANGQALNGIPCTFTVTGPNSYNQQFVTANIIGGQCSYNFTQFQLPSVSGSYNVTLTVEGDSGNLTTPASPFSREFDINLSGGILPGATTTIPDPVNYTTQTNPVFYSPVLKKFNTTTNVDQGTPCKIILYYDSVFHSEYTNTVNINGQCVVTIPYTSIIDGNLTANTEVTLNINGTDFDFLSAESTITVVGFPSHKALEDVNNLTRPVYTTITTNPSPSYIDNNITLAVNGLQDSANLDPLGSTTCNFSITGPNSFALSKPNITVIAGVCSVTLNGNTELPIVDGTYSFTVTTAGDNGTLTTPATNFGRNYDIFLSGNLIPGANTSTQNPLLIGLPATITSPDIDKADDTTNIPNGTVCKIVMQIDSNPATEYGSTINNGRCIATIPSNDLTAQGTAYIKTVVSLFNSDYNTEYTFETANSTFPIRFPPTAQICANPTFRDDDGNTAQNGSEPLLAGVSTRLYDSLSQLVGSLTTSSTGPNCFTDLFDGIYRLEQTPQLVERILYQMMEQLQNMQTSILE
ncbi:hypothetical protein HC766_03600 [Candidatus Gracilibacteria bacterium]|nr:hypothetical protein [Candidatus Gracilibacteria bacterium]